jgi:hypothetical protein
VRAGGWQAAGLEVYLLWAGPNDGSRYAGLSAVLSGRARWLVVPAAGHGSP